MDNENDVTMSLYTYNLSSPYEKLRIIIQLIRVFDLNRFC